MSDPKKPEKGSSALGEALDRASSVAAGYMAAKNDELKRRLEDVEEARRRDRAVDRAQRDGTRRSGVRKLFKRKN